MMGEPQQGDENGVVERSKALRNFLSAAANRTISTSARFILYGAAAYVAIEILAVNPDLKSLDPELARFVTAISQTVQASPLLATLVEKMGSAIPVLLEKLGPGATVNILARVGFRKQKNTEVLVRELEQALGSELSEQFQELGRQVFEDPYFQSQFRTLVGDAIAEADLATESDVYRIERKRQRDDQQRHAELLDSLRLILEQLSATSSSETYGGVHFHGVAGNFEHTKIAGRDIIETHVYAPPPTVDLDEALILLDHLPLDHIPEPTPVPTGSRLVLNDDPNFTGRDAELHELAAILKAGESVAIGQPVAVSGLGGIGKSSLANAFVHRYGRFFAGGVFWLSFADPAAISSELAACGAFLELHPNYADLEHHDQVALTQRAWENPLPRLLIFDNCEDQKLLDECRPKSGGCRVLVTSRIGVWDPARGLNTINLQALPRTDSVAFLRKLARHLGDGEADAIAAELGDFPLALYLAGSFLDRYRSVSPEAYVQALRNTNPLDHPSMRGRGGGYNPTQHERNVHKTFLLSLERLDADDPVDRLAHDLLRRAACFAPGEAIPRILLVSSLPEADEAHADHGLVIDDALHRLLGFGLLEPAGENSVRVLRLLSAFIAQLGVADLTRIAVEQVIGREAGRLWLTGFPSAFAPVLPHLRYVTHEALARAEDQHSAWLCNQLAELLKSQGDYATARLFCERALTIREQVLGPDHIDIANSLNNLAGLLQTQGDLAAARSLHERALAICEKIRGPDHADTATSLNNLADVLRAQGDYTTARALYERAIRIDETFYGSDHPEVATDITNLAYLIQSQGDHAAAQLLYERALAIREEKLGPGHPDVANSLYHLAGLMRAKRFYAPARSLYERALAIVEQSLGHDHPTTRLVRRNLEQLNAVPGSR